MNQANLHKIISILKGTTEASPEGDMENSTEFTTADFYFEDSMPSSISTESPPKRASTKGEKSEGEEEHMVKSVLSLQQEVGLKEKYFCVVISIFYFLN